jgi:Uncharacterized protein conserved in bacteria
MKTFVLAAALAVFPAMASAADLEISDAFLRAAPVATAGAGYAIIKNTGPADDTLLGAEADISKKVELHTHVRDGDVMRMRAVPSIPVPAGGSAELKTGGDHIMFIGLTRPLKEGEVVEVTLVFAKAGKTVVKMPVHGLPAHGKARH